MGGGVALKPYRDQQTAAAGGHTQVDLCTAAVRDLTHNRQPQAAAVGVRIVQAKEALEHPVSKRLGYARPVILHV